MITQVILTVEVDTSFYAIPAKEHVRKWCEDTPENFRFVVKAYQGMTGHLRGEIPFESKMICSMLLLNVPMNLNVMES